jgi:hypothetical protein
MACIATPFGVPGYNGDGRYPETAAGRFVDDRRTDPSTGACARSGVARTPLRGG